MQAVEEFMKEYLRDLSVITKKGLEDFAHFRDRFYSGSCPLGEHRLRRLKDLSAETEILTHVSTSGQAAEAVTRKVGRTGENVRLRYRLKQQGCAWRIHDVELECPECGGSAGASKCSICEGSGWWRFLGKERLRTANTKSRKAPRSSKRKGRL